MSHGDTSRRSADAQPDADPDGTESRTDRLPVSNLPSGVQNAATSGRLAGASGGVLVLRGLQRFRRGARVRGLVQALAGAALFGVAVVQRRSGRRGSEGSAADRGSVDQTDVVDTAPDLGAVDSSQDSGPSTQASGDEASEVVDTAPDVEDAARPPEERDEDHASGDEASEVVDTGIDVENATTDDHATTEIDDEATTDAETTTEAGETEEADQSDDDERWTEVGTVTQDDAAAETETDAANDVNDAGTEMSTGVDDAGTEMGSEADEAGTEDESTESGMAGETFEVEAEFVERSSEEDETGADEESA